MNKTNSMQISAIGYKRRRGGGGGGEKRKKKKKKKKKEEKRKKRGGGGGGGGQKRVNYEQRKPHRLLQKREKNKDEIYARACQILHASRRHPVLAGEVSE